MTKILVFEDETISAEDIRLRLEALGYLVVRIVPSAAEALQLVEQDAPDLILMDVGLQGKPDGIEAAALIQAACDIPIVFMTVLGDDETIIRAQASKPSGFIVKPFTNALIKATIVTALNLGELRKKEKEKLQEIELVRQRQALLSRVLGILIETLPWQQVCQKLVATIKSGFMIDAVGLRLQKNLDYPYFSQFGFSDEFVLSENSLLSKDVHGGSLGSSADDCVLDCVCGQVITGSLLSGHPCMTPGGSAWTNGVAHGFGCGLGTDQRAGFRQRCLQEGYKSIAIVPIRDETRVVGTLQLNHTAPGRFSLTEVEFLEDICRSIGSALLRRRMEESLVRHDAFLDAAQRMAGMGGWEWNCESGALYWTEETYRIHDMDPGSYLLGSPDHLARCLACYEPADGPLLIAAYDACRNDGLPFVQDLQFTSLKGRKGWVRLSAKPILADGKPVRIIGQIMDISQQKEAETRLQRENQLYSALLAIYEPMMSPRISMTRIATRILDWARQLCRSRRGYVSLIAPSSEENVILAGDDDHGGLVAGLCADLDCPKHLDGILSVPVCLGTETVGQICLADPSSPFTEEDLKVVSRLSDFYAIAIQRKRDEDILRKSEGMFKALIENLDVYVYAIKYDSGSRVSRYDSPRCLDITGYDPAELGANPELWFDLIHPDDRGKILAYIERIHQGKTAPAVTHRIVRKDGTISWVLNIHTAEFTEDGSLQRTQGFMVDMNERMLMEHELVLARKAAEQANSAKSQFIASVSHELRTPLNAILGFAQLLARDPSNRLDNAQKAYVDAVNTSGEHLLGMIGNILDLAKIEAGKLELDARPFSLETMTRKLFTTVQSLAEQNHITLELDLDPEAGILEADEVRVRQILYNLLSNAIKFTAEGRRVGLQVRGDGERVLFVIWDEGSGIAGEDQHRILEPFEQVHHGEAGTGGAGLGLAITKQLVDLHGGTLEVQSEPGTGSRFSVRLQGRTPERRTAQEKPESAKGDSLLHEGMRPEAFSAPARLAERGAVLVVEDNPVNQKLMQAVLGESGWKATIAATGEEAVELAKTRQFCLVLMDINLPGIDGLEAMKRIRSLERNRRASDSRMPIIALTAHVMRGDRERFLAEGMDDVIPKPIVIRQLQETLALHSRAEPGAEATAAREADVLATSAIPGEYDVPAVAAALSIPEESLWELIDYFFAELADTYLGELETAVKAPDPLAINKAVHKLTGTLSNLRFDSCLPFLEKLAGAAAAPGDFDLHACFLGLKTALYSLRDRLHGKPPIQGNAVHLGASQPEALRSAASQPGVPQSGGLQDRERGLLLVGGDSTLYAQLLDNFSRVYSDFAAELKASLESGRPGEALRIVHGLKGAAASLGFAGLETEARKLESRMNEGKTLSIDDAETRRLLSSLEALLSTLAKVDA